MFVLALLLLAASSTTVELVNEVFTIPGGEWRYVEFGLNQRPASVEGTYRVESGSAKVRLALMRQEDLDRMRNDQPHGVVAVTPEAAAGTLSYHVRRPDSYVVLVDNRDGSTQARVRLKITLDFAPRTQGPEVTRLSPRRQLTVILISFAVFFAIVSYSARRLLGAIRR